MNQVSHLFSPSFMKRGNRRRSLQHKRTFILPAGKGVYDAFECISSSELMSSNALKEPKLLLFPIFSFTFCGVQKERRSVFFIQFSSLPFSFQKYKAFSSCMKTRKHQRKKEGVEEWSSNKMHSSDHYQEIPGEIRLQNDMKSRQTRALSVRAPPWKNGS